MLTPAYLESTPKHLADFKMEFEELSSSSLIPSHLEANQALENHLLSYKIIKQLSIGKSPLS